MLSETLENTVAAPQEIGGPKHIIIIIVDSLRKRNVSLYGYDRQTTVFLDKLARSGAVFDNAIATSSWTFPSLASMMTGVYPHKHGGVHANEMRNFWKEKPNMVRSDLPSLPELLSRLGFRTNYITAISTGALAVADMFERSSVYYGTADLHMREAMRWLKKHHDSRTFTVVQLGDVHYPIDRPPSSYTELFGDIADIPDLDGWQYLTDGTPGDPEFERYRENRMRLYDCALRFVDDQIARLFACVDDLGIRDSSLVVVTADHGEEFWDHVELERHSFSDPRGVYGTAHGHDLFQELINVPLICVGAGVKPGRYNHVVSLLDLCPTILESCGIEHELIVDGHNLFAPVADRFVLSEGTAYGYEKKAVIKENWKLIHSAGDNITLLYDLSQDSQERHNLATKQPSLVRELCRLLPGTGYQSEALAIDRDVEEQLRFLGYM